MPDTGKSISEAQLAARAIAMEGRSKHKKKGRCQHCADALELLKMLGLVKTENGQRVITEPPPSERKQNGVVQMHGSRKNVTVSDAGGLKSWRQHREGWELPEGLRNSPDVTDAGRSAS